MIIGFRQFQKSLLQELHFQSSRKIQKSIQPQKKQISKGLNAEKPLQVLEKVINKGPESACSQIQLRGIYLVNTVQQESFKDILSANGQNNKFGYNSENVTNHLEILSQQKQNEQELLKIKPEGDDLFLKSIHCQMADLVPKKNTQNPSTNSLVFSTELSLDDNQMSKSNNLNSSKINFIGLNQIKQQNKVIFSKGKLISKNQDNENDVSFFNAAFNLIKGQSSNKISDNLATKQSSFQKQNFLFIDQTNYLSLRDHNYKETTSTRVNNQKKYEKKIFK
ncbi:hypothetical protein ABPG74_013091 [Tetrahymena malaccensis]